jgi:phage tail protein X
MKTYTTIQGDTWDTIAFNMYGDVGQVGLLMQANLSLLDYFEFPAGIVVNVPDVSETDDYDEDYPDWRSDEDEF